MSEFWWGFFAGIGALFLACTVTLVWIVRNDPDPTKSSEPSAYEPPVSMAAFYANREWEEKERMSASYTYASQFGEINAQLYAMRSQLEDLAWQVSVSKVIDEVIEKHTVSEN
jgi:hypothetical protein